MSAYQWPDCFEMIEVWCDSCMKRLGISSVDKSQYDASTQRYDVGMEKYTVTKCDVCGRVLEKETEK